MVHRSPGGWLGGVGHGAGNSALDVEGQSNEDEPNPAMQLSLQHVAVGFSSRLFRTLRLTLALSVGGEWSKRKERRGGVRALSHCPG